MDTRLIAVALMGAVALLTACGGANGTGVSTDGGTEVPTDAGIDGGAPLATVTRITVGPASYGQSALVTVDGTSLGEDLTVASPGCKNMVLGPQSTASTAHFTCTVAAVGTQTVTATRRSDHVTLMSASYTVEMPQVTLTVSNGLGVNGNLVITLEPVKTPVTTDNFLAYVKSGFFVGTAFHRVIAGFAAQGGGFAAPINVQTTPTPKPDNPPIVLEDGAGLSNLKYTVAMARTSMPDSASSEFFINLGDNTYLDKTPSARGFAVFGAVTGGTAVADALGRAPCTAASYSECVPVPNVVITAATQTR